MVDHTITLDCPVEECGTDFTVELYYEPGDSNYGADADGNRGMYVPGYWYPDEMPACCPNGHVFSPEELKALDKTATALADEYEYE